MTEIPKHLQAIAARARAQVEAEHADDVIVATNPRDRIPAHLLQRSKAVANPQEPVKSPQEEAFVASFMDGILHGIKMDDAAMHFEATGEIDLELVIANKDRTIEASQKVIAGLKDALEMQMQNFAMVNERNHRIIDALLSTISFMGQEQSEPEPEPTTPEPRLDAFGVPFNPYASRRAMFLLDLPGGYLNTHKRALIAIRDEIQEKYGREMIMVPYLDPSDDDDTAWDSRTESRVTVGLEMVCTDEEAAER